MTDITVVTVVRNNLLGLQSTVAALKEQDPGVFEHVVIDGDSTDGTRDYLESLRTDYRFRWVSEPDDGLYDAMNKGIRLSSSRVVFFLNGADTLRSPDVLRQVADSWRAEQWEWAFGAIDFVDHAGNRVDGYTGTPYSKRQVELGRAYIPHPATFVVRDTLIDLQGFDPRFGLSADQELILRVAERSDPAVFSDVLTRMEIGGAHASIGPTATARRYQAIRLAHGRLVGNSRAVDELWTLTQGALWGTRQVIREKLLGKPRM